MKAKSGNTVKIHYTGRLEDGTVFDTSRDREPLEFTVGEGQVIEGFEKAVMGMDVNESKNVDIPADEAYGEYRDELLLEVDRGQFPAHIDPKVGQDLQIQEPGGVVFPVTVTGVNEATVTLDANHPLAGKALNFEIELVGVC
jgi:peptidylprolyl isomerase